MRVQKRSWRLPLVLVAVLASACSSTVQVSSTTTDGGPLGATTGGDGLGTSGSTLSPQESTSGGVAGPGTTGGTTGEATGSTATGGRATGTAGGQVSGPPTAVGANGPGVSAKEIKVGMLNDVNAGAVNEAVGVGAITPGDAQANAAAIIKDINAHGGVAGRKLVPVYADFDSTSTQTLDQQYAAACERLTQDEKVFAFVGTALRESFVECMTRAGVVFLSQALPLYGAQTFRARPGFLETGYANVDRLAAFHLKPLVDQKYFTPWNASSGRPATAGVVKVGVLTYNDRVFAPAVDNVLVPAIKKLGHPVTVVKIAPLSGASDVGAQGAAVKSAQLTFAANSVTHVIPFESNGGLSTFFLPHARSQGYYPRYGVYTGSASEALLESGIVDARQMNGAVGYGWMPSVDLRRVDNAANAPWSNANRRHCQKVMRDNGITFDSGNAEGVAMNQCSSLYLLQRAAGLVPRALNLSTFVSAVEGLARAYQGAGTIAMRFGPGRHDASEGAYQWRYVSSCTCFRYFGAQLTIP